MVVGYRNDQDFLRAVFMSNRLDSPAYRGGRSRDEAASVGSNHPQVAIVLELLGDTAALRNQMDLCRDYFGRALHIMTQKFGEGSAISAAVFANWGVAEQRSGDNGVYPP